MEWFLTTDPSVVYSLVGLGVLLSLCGLLAAQPLAVQRFSQPGYVVLLAFIIIFLHSIPHALPMLVIYGFVQVCVWLRTPWRWPLGWLIGSTLLYGGLSLAGPAHQGMISYALEQCLVMALLSWLLWRWRHTKVGQGPVQQSIYRLQWSLQEMLRYTRDLRQGVRRQPSGQQGEREDSVQGEPSLPVPVFLQKTDYLLRQHPTRPYHILCFDTYAWRLLSQHGGENAQGEFILFPPPFLWTRPSESGCMVGFLGEEQELRQRLEVLLRRLRRGHRQYGHRNDLLFFPACIGTATFPQEGKTAAALAQLARKRLDVQRRHQWKQEVGRQRQLEKLAAIGQLAAGLAHEIRNPLTSIRGFLQIAAAESGPLKKWEPIMLAEMDRINDLLKQFLKLSETKPVCFRRFLLDQLVHDVLSLLKPKAFLMGHALVAIPPAQPIELVADAERIKQILINLIQNGLEALGSQGKVEIGWRKVNGRVVIQIEDDGQGIDHSHVTRIFDPFFTTKRDGTGMGLAVCQRIVKEHGGKIQVTSKTGRGTQFTLQLPLAQPDGEAVTAVTYPTLSSRRIARNGESGEIHNATAWVSYGREVQ